MCDVCSDFSQLLTSYEPAENSNESTLTKYDIEILLLYSQTLPNRQCICWYREPKNFEKFNLLTQHVVHFSIAHFKYLIQTLRNQNHQKNNESKEGECEDEDVEDSDGEELDVKTRKQHENFELQDSEKLFHLVSKIFLMNYPLYVAYKHTVIQSKLEEITHEELSNLNEYCDLNDQEIPIYLLRNVVIFCKLGGIQLMTKCFQYLTPQMLPITTAHSIILIVCNLKLWLNVKITMDYLVTLRAKVLKYMHHMPDNCELRTQQQKTLAENMWIAIKDPIDLPLLGSLDYDGLNLAFKYFTSSTMSMRLAGFAQITNHISMLSDLQCAAANNQDSFPNDIEQAPKSMADWLIHINIISQIFGPNLHVEIIKQSQVILNFLAMQNRLTIEHINIIWAAAQLKHCSKTVYDLLPGLIKHLNVQPIMHLYKLLSVKLEPKDHTEQTLYLAQLLCKFIWNRSCCEMQINEAQNSLMTSQVTQQHKCQSISDNDNSISISNSDEEEDEDEEEEEEEDETDEEEETDDGVSSDTEHQSIHQMQKLFDMKHEGGGGGSGKGGCSKPISRKTHLIKKNIRKKLAANKHIVIRKKHIPVKKIIARSLKDRKQIEDRGAAARRRLVINHRRRMLMNHRRQIGITQKLSQQVLLRNKRLFEKKRQSQKLREKLKNKLLMNSNLKKEMTSTKKLNFFTSSKAKYPHGRFIKNILLDKKKYQNKLKNQIICLQDLQQMEHEDDSSDSDSSNFDIEDESDIETYKARHQHNIILGNSGANIFKSVIMSDEELARAEVGSNCSSSRLSATAKSEKNLGDFEDEEEDEEDSLNETDEESEDEEGVCGISSDESVIDEDEFPVENRVKMLEHSRVTAALKAKLKANCDEKSSGVETVNLDNVCEPGQTLLWDLLQDDKIGELSEGIAIECEKVLVNLLCYSDRGIRMKFIEGCLKNLSKNQCVVVSLRLLPKLFTSFQQLRASMSDTTHHITNWADRQHSMMLHFFNNLEYYTKQYKNSQTTNQFYSHQKQIQVRLHFLSAIYSTIGSPNSFKLTIEQLDTLWQCIAYDSECNDELFSWLLSQIKNSDQHALGIDSLKRLYLTHLPCLPPENMNTTCLSLFYHLFNLAQANQIFNTDEDKKCEDDESLSPGVDYLWKVALCAKNTDVSMTAIPYLNNYYLSQRLLSEENHFVQKCMSYLMEVSNNLDEQMEISLNRIQRALILLKTHLETFKKKYSYHLRRWALNGHSITTHHTPFNIDINSGGVIRVNIQLSGMSERTQIELMSTDYIGELRAECANLLQNYFSVQKWNEQQGNNLLVTDPGVQIRMITQGQELLMDFDEKTLQEIGFKDNQLVFISLSCKQNLQARNKKMQQFEQFVGDAPPKECIPMLLLLKPNIFEELFVLMRRLSSINHFGVLIKGEMLSRRVWDIITMLPTYPKLLNGFQNSETLTQQELTELLDPNNIQKLIYSLHIVQYLANFKESNSDSKSTSKKPDWAERFIKNGGLRHLFDIFMSGVLQANKCQVGSEWQQDCLATLLKTIYQLGTMTLAMKEAKNEKVSTTKDLKIPLFNEVLLAMVNSNNFIEAILKILFDIYSSNIGKTLNELEELRTGFCGRAQVVHFTMALLVSYLHSIPNNVEAQLKFLQDIKKQDLLERLILEEPDPTVRREMSVSIYKLCLGTSTPAVKSSNLTAHTLNLLLNYLDKASEMKPEQKSNSTLDENKEPYGATCHDFFWLLCRLTEGVKPDTNIVDINKLCYKVMNVIEERSFFEERHRGVMQDDGLVGLLNLMTNLLKHRVTFQTATDGGCLMLNRVLEYLFALPNSKERYKPKCKSPQSRSASYDLLVELVKYSPQNYNDLRVKLLKQHEPGQNTYPWDYWPHDDGRSECGYVGLTNLGATCYMASCMQHLYMMPQARQAILSMDNQTGEIRHEQTLSELQRMFAYLMESERKAYNPRSFCKVYQMNNQALNTGEQKDMAEFFIDLVSKLEEMTPHLNKMVKQLFCGTLTNNVVSLDCDHVSRTLEDFYTVRCQVADMRNLYESLDEVTVKDTLEGDNMYTCSQCGRKVRAEKRACFKKLPHILCFNTMRYTFNMVTMLKEKVNTHFSFPLRLNMAGYVEKKLMPEKVDVDDEQENYEYDLIGVTVHTGTADGGHYYSFIKDRYHKSKNPNENDRWLLFNDAEVKLFDANQLANECFGGEMTSKTYDSVTEKFMDFSFEKTNSAYMLFYEHAQPSSSNVTPSGTSANNEIKNELTKSYSKQQEHIQLSKQLEDWIWEDNMNFIRDKNIFEHTYFNFIWQICGHLPQTLADTCPLKLTKMAAELTTCFFLETFIHSKEKPTMVQWVELLTKQFNACQEACEWFLEHMTVNTWWSIQVLIKCPNQMIRQMFQRLCIHVIQRLRQTHSSLYLQCPADDPDQIGNKSCVTKFIKSLLLLLDNQATKAHLKHLTEYFGFLYEFCRMGDEEPKFLIAINAISTMVHFYLGHKVHDFIDISEGDDDEDVSLPTDKYKPASLDKMIALIAMLVEKSRHPITHQLTLSHHDYNAIAQGAKGFPFLYQQTKDNINLAQTRNLIHSICKDNDRLANMLVTMISQAINRHPDSCQPFFKLLTLLTETSSTSSSSSQQTIQVPSFTQLVLQRVWEAAESCPQAALDWLSVQVQRNKSVHQWVLQSVDSWCEHFLIAHSNQRVRSAAATLLISLVPSSTFRQNFRTRHLNGGTIAPYGSANETALSEEAHQVLTQIYNCLLRLMPTAKLYTDVQIHGFNKLTAYFAVMTYCCISKKEKLMFNQYFMHLWHLFHPNISEPQVAAFFNKQALFVFWYHVCVDCPENVHLILQNAYVTKNIAFNYILADHDDQEVLLFNRNMLPAYYGLLRLCCLQSRAFTRSLANHQNIQWAFKNITPHHNQYASAVDELYKLMHIFLKKFPDSTEQELVEIEKFRRTTLTCYLQCLDGRSNWSTIITAFRVLIDTDQDKLFIVCNNGLSLIFESIITLHIMYHESSSNSSLMNELNEILILCLDLIKTFRHKQSNIGNSSSQSSPSQQDYNSSAKAILLSFKDFYELIRKLATLLNTYNPSEMRTLAIDILKEILLLAPEESLEALVPLLSHCHTAFQESNNMSVALGPYFPRRNMQVQNMKNSRPLRPMVQMAVPTNQLETPKGKDLVYDKMLEEFYEPYHEFIDLLCRVAVNNNVLSEVIITLSAIVGFEAVPLHSTFFAKLWLDILKLQHMDKKCMQQLTQCNYFIEYVDAIILDERTALTVQEIYHFLLLFLPKVINIVLTEPTCNLIDNIVISLCELCQNSKLDLHKDAQRLCGDLRALYLVYNAAPRLLVSQATKLVEPLQFLAEKTKTELNSLDNKEFFEAPSKKRKLETSSSSSSSSSDGNGNKSSNNNNNSASKSDSEIIAGTSTSSPLPSTSKNRSTRSLNYIHMLDSVIKELIVLIEKCDSF